MFHHLKAVLRTWLLAWVNPALVCRMVRSLARPGAVRWYWCGLGGLIGLVAALACGGYGSWPALLVLGLIGSLLGLILSVDLGSDNLDSLGLMALAICPLLLLFPTGYRQPDPLWFNLRSALYVTVAIGGLWLYSRFIRGYVAAGLNRSFMFWPMLPAGMVLLGFSELDPWPVRVLARFDLALGRSAFVCGCLLMMLLLFRVQAAYVCLESSRQMGNTEAFSHAHLAMLKRRTALLYAFFTLACLAAWWIDPEMSAPLPMAFIFLAAAALELDLLLWPLLAAWLARARRRGTGLTEANANPLFRLPGVPLEVPGVAGLLEEVSQRQGARAAAGLAVDLLLRTCYHRAARRFVEGLAALDPVLYHESASRLQSAAPRPQGQPARMTGSTLSRPPLPALIPLSASAAEDEALFRHGYQHPRGEEVRPLAAMPIWFPVASYPVETMTLPQILYRTLASTRVPFRRTRLVLASEGAVPATFASLLRGLATRARSQFGAGLLPVPLSVARLLGQADELAARAEAVTRARTETGLCGGPSPDALVLEGWRRVLEIGSPVPLPDGVAGELVDSLRWGNAWVLVEDDSAKGADLGPPRRLFDLLLGDGGLTQVALLQVTGRKENRVLSDMQTFDENPPSPPPPDLSLALPDPKEVARVARAAGDPSADVSPTASQVLAVAAAVVIGLVWMGYDRVWCEKEERSRWWVAGALLAALAVGGVPLSYPWSVGYRWGLSRGSEELRRAAVGAIASPASFVTLFSGLTLCLPALAPAGFWRDLFVPLACLPPAFLWGVAWLQTLMIAAKVGWLRRSRKILRSLDEEGWRRLAGRFRVELHVARRGAVLQVGDPAAPRLPLLVSFEASPAIPRLLEAFPSLAPLVREAALQSLRKGADGGDVAVASLLIVALSGNRLPQARRCARLLAADCRANWPWLGGFGTYLVPGTSLELNSLDYAARHLCYLTDIEEVIAVR